jgi:hypothetical protein
MSENMEARGKLRKLHNEELHNLNFSPNVISVNKSSRMRWAESVASKGEKRNPYVCVGQPER